MGNESKRITLFKQQSGLCFWCGEKLLHPNDPQTANPKYPTLDHVIAKKAGGGRGDNLRVSCQECNKIRGQFNTGAWVKEKLELKDTISRQAKVIQSLKGFVVKQQHEKTKLTETIHVLVKSYEPMWRKIFKWLAKSMKKGSKPE